jgi:hypothetical protein
MHLQAVQESGGGDGVNSFIAIRHANRLWEIWIGPLCRKPQGFDFDRIHASMLQDYRYRRNKPQFAGVCREIRGQFVLLGKVRKALEVSND